MQCENVELARLPDETLTADIAAAQERFPPRQVRMPSVDGGAGPTPQRLKVLAALVEDGMINAVNAKRLVLSGGRVPDRAWELILSIQGGQTDGHGQLDLDFSTKLTSQIRLLRRPCWTARFKVAACVIPVEFDPLPDQTGELPFDRVLQVLDALSCGDWTLVHVSEDRQVKRRSVRRQCSSLFDDANLAGSGVTQSGARASPSLPRRRKCVPRSPCCFLC